MKEIFGVQIDTSSMTTEELVKTRNEIREFLTDVEFQLQMRKMAEHKYSSGAH